MQKMKIPLALVVLDFVGMAFIGLGLAEKFANTGLVPRSMQFPNYEWIMIGIGVMLAVPFITHIVKTVIRQSEL